MAVPRDHRWKTRFGQWVMKYGVERLAQQLEVTKSAVYFWLRLKGRIVYPDPERALKMVELSCGSVNLEAIYTHRREAQAMLLGVTAASGDVTEQIQNAQGC